ncbi:MAG: DUF3352 domain-containing protein, partial [Cyanobacteria bacterium]|nr:DUF3352 domain-containing protein [Cyanobacteriota bacterium]
PEPSPEAPPQGKHPEPLMALSSGHFIFASSKTVMDEALSTEKTKKTILDNPFFKANLHHLPSQRQGTFLISSTGMQSNDLSDPSLKPLLEQDPSLKKNLENSVSLSNAIPGSVSALKIQGDQLITIDSYSPIDFSKIENTTLRDDFKGFITNSATYDLPTVLPKSTIALVGMTNLSKFYDLYMTHLATDAQKAKISTTENQLKLMRIDLRKDIVSCLDGKAGFGIVGNEGMSPDYLVFLNMNEGTKKVMEQVSALATTIAQATKTEKSMNSGAHTMTLLESPRSPIKLAYGDIMKDAMAIGTAPGVENIYTTQQNASTSLNNSPLFKTLMGDSPDKVSGFLFLNVQEGRALLEKIVAQRGGAGAPQMAVLNFLKGIDGVYAISYPENDALLKGHFAIKLAAPSP